jgi:hypothetical protein
MNETQRLNYVDHILISDENTVKISINLDHSLWAKINKFYIWYQYLGSEINSTR